METVENKESADEGIHFSKLFTQESLDELYKKFAGMIAVETDLMAKPIVQFMYEEYIVPHKDVLLAKLKELGLLLNPMDIAVFLQDHCLCVYFGRLGIEGRALTREEKNWLSGILFWESGDEDDGISMEQSITEQRVLSLEFIDFSVKGALNNFVEKYNECFKSLDK